MKNRKAITLLLTANIISGCAQGISMLAIPWYFTKVLGDAPLFGKIYALITFSNIFWNLYAGTLIDRYPRKRIFIFIALVSGIIISGTALYGYYAGDLGWEMIALVFCTTMLNYNIYFPSLYAFGQEISSKENYGKISSYLEIQNQFISLASGGMAAILLSGTAEEINLIGIKARLPFRIEPWSMHEIFLFDGITYFIAAIIIFFITYTRLSSYVPETGSIISRLKGGFRFLRKHPLLFMFGNLSYSIFVVLMVEAYVLMPLYISSHLNRSADVFASADIYYSLGAIAAGVLISRLFKNMSTVLSIIILMVVTIAILLMVTFTQYVGIFYLFSFLLGVTNAGARVQRVTFLFHHVGNHIIGRTNSVFSVINIFLRSVFIALFSLPFFAGGNNVVWGFFILSVFILVSVIPLVVKYRDLRAMKIET